MESIYKIFTIKVRCPINNYVYEMPMGYHTAADGTVTFLPCRGCENCGMDPVICTKCRTALTLMYHHGYRHEPGKPVIPNLEEY